MSEISRPQTPKDVMGIRDKNSPPPSPPSPSYNDPETKSSRKREREVSIEPVTTPKASANDSDPFVRELKETRTPAKKNKIHLDSTAEEDDNGSSGSNSPPDVASLGTSSPQEIKIKVRQISQGVEDLSWKNLKGTTTSQDDVSVVQESNSVDNERHEADTMTMNTEEEECSGSTCAEIKIDEEATMGKGDEGVSDGLSTVHENSITRRDSGSDSGEKEKGLKRKYLERGTSAGPQEGEEKEGAAETTKRPRDDADEDANPRETKRPTPPPDSEKAAAPKVSGFMAYASTSSPFAAVKGQNIFASSKSSTPSSSKSTTPPTVPSPTPFTTPAPGEPSTSSSTPAKRSGFEAFASSSSPFATAARAKSPALGSASRLGRPKSPQRRANTASTSAFSAYASGVQSFALPLQKRPRAGSPSSSSSLERNSTVGALGGGANTSVFDSSGSGADDDRDDRPSSFGEKLRAGKDEEEQSEDEQPKIMLSEQEVTTGEEDEETIHQVRGKLYALADGAWKERGTGLLKLNVRASDGGGARLVMRKEAVYTVLLNVTLFHGMRCELAQDPRYVRFSVIEDGATTHYNLRLANAKIAQELMEEIHGNLPSA